MAAFPSHPLLPPHTFQGYLNPRLYGTSLQPHCHLRSHLGSRPPGGLEVESLSSPLAGPSAPSCLTKYVWLSERVLLPAEVNQYPERELCAIFIFTHCLAELIGHSQGGLLTLLVIQEFMREERHSVKPNQLIFTFHNELSRANQIQKQSEIKVFSSIIP